MKKIIIAAFIFIFMTVTFARVDTKASSFSTQYGFTYNTDIYQNVGWQTNKTNYSKMSGRTIGATTTTAGYYRINAQYNENPAIDLYTVMARYTMTPMKTEVYKCGLFNMFSCQDHGYSNKLIVKSQLDYYTSGANNYLAYYSPTTMYNSTTYKVGGGIEYSQKDGFGGGVNVEATFRSDDMKIKNLTQSPLRLYGTEFNYNMRSFVIKESFYTETYNYSMYIIENPVSQTAFSNRLEVIGEFGHADGWGRLDIYYTSNYYRNQTNVYFQHIK